MSKTLRALAFALPLALAASAGCNFQKSTPTSPAVPGVETSAPSDQGSGERRTPDPLPGLRLGLPDMTRVVEDVARRYPDALRNSCQENGGSWEFMDRLLDELRKHDTRWGYNWKRRTVGDPSLDVINYHWGIGPDEGSIEVYTIDVIMGHCGDNPSPMFMEITDHNGPGAMWTGRGRF